MIFFGENNPDGGFAGFREVSQGWAGERIWQEYQCYSKLFISEMISSSRTLLLFVTSILEPSG